MSNILNKIKDFVGLNKVPESGEYDYYHEEDISLDAEEEEEDEVPIEDSHLPPSPPSKPAPSKSSRYDSISGVQPSMIGNARNNVIGMPGVSAGMSEVIVFEPHSFDEVPQVITTLKEGKSVVLNLNTIDPEEAQRAVDFVAGGTFAIDGHQERIGESIFLFTPSCVKVSTLSRRDMEELNEPIKPPTRVGNSSFWTQDSTRPLAT